MATGLKLARPELKVFVVTGDGDGLSIGGNHLLHVLRRNVDVTILLFNNRIYGLTKGQYSPTSELGKVTKSTPLGSADRPVSPCSFALACGATSGRPHRGPERRPHGGDDQAGLPPPGRRLRRDPAELQRVQRPRLERAVRPRAKVHSELRLEHGKPLVWGPPDDRRGLVLEGVRPKVVAVSEVAESALWVHDERDTAAALVLSQLWAPDYPIPVGVLANVEAPIYEDMVLQQEQQGDRGPRARRHRPAPPLRRHLDDRVAPRAAPGTDCGRRRDRRSRLERPAPPPAGPEAGAAPRPPHCGRRRRRFSEALAAIVGPSGVVSTPEGRLTYECDMHTFYKGAPDVVVLPRSAEQVADGRAPLPRGRVPVVPRGSGTGLIGGAMAPLGGVMVATTRMNRILALDLPNRCATVEPGLINLWLSRGGAAPRGYFFAPDPSSQMVSSIGGNASTNAGGPHCLKYGITVNHVLGLQLVTGAGELVWLGGRPTRGRATI